MALLYERDLQERQTRSRARIAEAIRTSEIIGEVERQLEDLSATGAGDAVALLLHVANAELDKLYPGVRFFGMYQKYIPKCIQQNECDAVESADLLDQLNCRNFNNGN